MRSRPLLGLLVALALLLAACGPPVASGPPGGTVPASAAGSQPAPTGATVAVRPGTRPGLCPTTRPSKTRFVPPAPFPATPPPLYGDNFWYGTDALWTWLPADGTWPMPGAPGSVQADKSFWWRKGYDWQTETSPGLRVTGRRLDAAAPPVTISGATNGFRDDIGAFMLLGLELPGEGCWELTGHYAGRSLRFVVWVR